MTVVPEAKRLLDRLRGGLLPAVLTPMDTSGTVNYAELERYAARLVGAAIDGLAVWAHTGRGLYLSREDRMRVLRTWRQVTPLPLVAGVGVPRSVAASTADQARAATLAMAEDAAAGGADAVMVYPPAALREHPERDAEVLALHSAVTEATGLPSVSFFLHDAAGGYRYGPDLVHDLLSLPSSVGIKTATLDRAIDCQDAIKVAREVGRLAITGEDRMFGPSLMWGADCALVGIAAARVDLTSSTLRSWLGGELTEFHRASNRLDQFAEATFLAPIEGYVQRMMWTAVWEGLISEDSAHDPYGPALPAGERDSVTAVLDSLGAAER